MRVYLAEIEVYNGVVYRWVRNTLTNESVILLKENFAKVYVERVNEIA